MPIEPSTHPMSMPPMTAEPMPMPMPVKLARTSSGVRADAVEPVVEHDDLVDVVAAGFVGILDDERRVERPVELEAHVRMEPVGPGSGTMNR